MGAIFVEVGVMLLGNVVLGLCVGWRLCVNVVGDCDRNLQIEIFVHVVTPSRGHRVRIILISEWLSVKSLPM